MILVSISNLLNFAHILNMLSWKYIKRVWKMWAGPLKTQIKEVGFDVFVNECLQEFSG